jgi:hypothetical protein
MYESDWVMKVMLPNCECRKGKTADTSTHETNGWVTVTTKRGRQVTPPGRYDPATGKTVTWSVTAAEVDVESKKTAATTGYYDIFTVIDSAEITTIAINHNLTIGTHI